jgi:hypothetical protein
MWFTCSLIMALLLSGCGSARHPSRVFTIPAALLREARPIGRGARSPPPATGSVIDPCSPRLGARNAVHVEVFAANRVVIVAAGIGTRAPRTGFAGRIGSARCYGALVTLDSTGVVLVRRGSRLTLSALFRSWGEPLTRSQLASFPAPSGTRVTVFVDGHRWHGPPGEVPLTTHSEIVLEVGPFVPPHQTYSFSPAA